MLEKMSNLVELSLLYRADKYEFTRGVNKQYHPSFPLLFSGALARVKRSTMVNKIW